MLTFRRTAGKGLHPLIADDRDRYAACRRPLRLAPSSDIGAALRTIPCLIRSPRVMRFRCQAPHRPEAWSPTSLQLTRPSSSRFPPCSLVFKPWCCSLAIRQSDNSTIRQFDNSTIRPDHRQLPAASQGLRGLGSGVVTTEKRYCRPRLPFSGTFKSQTAVNSSSLLSQKCSVKM